MARGRRSWSNPEDGSPAHVRNYSGFIKPVQMGRSSAAIIARDRPLRHLPTMIAAVKIAVLQEAARRDPRVAAIPETVKKFIGLGAEVAVERAPARTPRSRRGLRRRRGHGRGRAAVSTAPRSSCKSAGPDRLRSPARRGAIWSARSTRLARRRRSPAYARPGSRRWRWNGCRASPAPSRWTSCRRSRTSPATRRWSTPPASTAAPFPMMMTAAGTVSAAKVFVMGVGVAGLQAIATARRLGAQVSATDVRSGDEGADPVARRQADLRRECRRDRGRGRGRLRQRNVPEYQAAQAELVSSHIAKQDIVITTALIPGRPAPRLISDAQLATMRTGERDRRPRGGGRRQCRGLWRGEA